MTIVCPPPPDPVLPEDVCPHSGFGVVTLCRDGVELERDLHGERDVKWYTAKAQRGSRPNAAPSVWTLHVDGPLISTIYALTENGWTLIERKDGFA